LTKADVALALKLITQQALESVQSRRAVILDLGPGTLTIHAGLAEFRFAALKSWSRASSVASASPSVAASQLHRQQQQQQQQQQQDHLAAPSIANSGQLRLTADVLSKLNASSTGSSVASNRNSAVGKSRAVANGGSRVAAALHVAAAGSELQQVVVPHAAAQQQRSRTLAQPPPSVVLPPGAAPLPPPEAIMESVRAAREAAKLNARIRVAKFVLPCGGPDDDDRPGADKPVPQGRYKPPTAAAADAPAAAALAGGGGDEQAQPAAAGRRERPKTPLAVSRALELAAERAERERADRAREEADRLAAMLARKAALDAEAEGIKEELRKKKKLLVVSD